MCAMQNVYWHAEYGADDAFNDTLILYSSSIAIVGLFTAWQQRQGETIPRVWQQILNRTSFELNSQKL